MEVTATALLCLNTSSRLSCGENHTQQHTDQPQTLKANQLIVTTACLFIIHKSATYLRLGEHVEAPGAHFPVSGNADQVVCVLGSYHVHTVDWVLNTTEHSDESLRQHTLRNKRQPEVKMQTKAKTKKTKTHSSTDHFGTT